MKEKTCFVLLIRERDAIVPRRKEEPHGTDGKDKGKAKELESEEQSIVVLKRSLKDDVKDDRKTKNGTKKGRNVVIVPGGTWNETKRKPIGKVSDPYDKRIDGMSFKADLKMCPKGTKR